MNQNQHTVLVINDSPDQLEMLEFILEQADYRVLTASGGNEGIEVIREKIPDLVVSDVMMPDGNGIQLCRAIRDDEKFRTLPVLLVSALRKDTASAIEGLKVGADDYLEAPFDPAYLLARVARLSDRKRMEDVLLGNENYFRSIIENFSDVISILSKEGTILYESPSIRRILGYEPETLPGKNAFDFVHPDDKAAVICYFSQAIQEKYESSLPIEYRFRHNDGSWRVLESVGSFVEDPNEGTVAVINSRDITGRLHAENIVRQSEANLAAAQRITRLGSWEVELDDLRRINNNKVHWSDEVYRIFGYEPGSVEVSINRYFNSIYPSDRTRSRRAFFEAVTYRKNLNIEFRIVLPTGDERILHGQAEVVYDESANKPLKFIGTVQDITERKRIENELRESEERYRFQAHLLDTVEQSVIATNLDGMVIYWNQFAEKLYGWSASETAGRNIMELTTPQTSVPQAEKIMSNLRVGRGWTGEFTVQRRDGKTFPAVVTNSPVYDEKGTLIGIIGISKDITEQKQTESALVEANERAVRQYNSLLQRLAKLGETVGIARDLNAVFGAILDFTRASAPCSALIVSLYDEKSKIRNVIYCWYNGNEPDISDLEAAAVPVGEGVVGQAVKTGELVVINDYLEAIQKSAVSVSVGFDEDTRKPQSSIIVPMKIKGVCIGIIEVQSYEIGAYKDEHATAMSMAANFVANAIENVRLLELERQREEQFRQSQKLESVGRLAGGIAHDFNNMLTAINGYSSLTLRRLKPDDPLRHNIEEIKKAGERSASLTHQLLAFSRRQVLKPKVLDINQTVNDVSFMLERLIGEDVRLISALSSELGQVKVDPGQLSQVIMNLVVNARDAMPDGGQLTIETSNVFLDEEFAARHVPTEVGYYVLLAVTDTGTGIDPETRKHIFEPFFTTKEVGKGTGLGLATVYGIVKQSGGYIWIDSEVGQGSTFKIYLPRVDECVGAEKKQSAPEELAAGTEAILLVEDEQMVRDLSRQILEDCGYTVLEAGNGVEALEICGQSDCKIDLLMTDVVMPQMGGRELAEKLAATHPRIKILFTSGYTDDSVVRHGVIEVGTNFIQKPFSPTALALKVRNILDAE